MNRQGKQRHNVLFLFVLSLLLCHQLTALEQPTLDVSERQGTLTVRVKVKAPLSAVLEEFCRRTRSQCEGLQKVPSEVLPESSFSGTWTQVVQQLLSGMKINYAATQPAPGVGGHLLIQTRSTQANDPLPILGTVTPRAARPVPPTTEEAGTAVVLETPGSSAGSVEASPVWIPSTDEANLQQAHTSAQGSSPFSLNNGHPLPASDAAVPDGSPFSMGNGRPIPPTKVVEDGSPFSYNGRPIPPTDPGQKTDAGPFPLRPSDKSSSPR